MHPRASPRKGTLRPPCQCLIDLLDTTDTHLDSLLTLLRLDLDEIPAKEGCVRYNRQTRDPTRVGWVLLYLTPYKAEGRLLPLTNTTFIDVDACQNPITHFTKYYLI